MSPEIVIIIIGAILNINIDKLDQKPLIWFYFVWIYKIHFTEWDFRIDFIQVNILLGCKYIQNNGNMKKDNYLYYMRI